MKGAPIGSCWVYTVDDNSMYRKQVAIILSSHRDALGDYDYEVWMSPIGREFELSDTVLERYFKCISPLEEI